MVVLCAFMVHANADSSEKKSIKEVEMKNDTNLEEQKEETDNSDELDIEEIGIKPTSEETIEYDDGYSITTKSYENLTEEQHKELRKKMKEYKEKEASSEKINEKSNDTVME